MFLLSGAKVMKKHLIALAVAGAVSFPAMAQNVSISGILDAGIGNDSITNNTNTRKTSNTGLANRNSTSTINFSGTEDLGGGMKASFFMNQSMNSGTGALAARDTWAAISGGFGELKIGRYTPGFETITAGYSQGGGTSLTAGTADFMFGSAIQDNAAATITSAPQAVYTEIGRGGAGGTGHIQFSTPTMNGLSAVVGYGRANNDASTTGSSTGFAQYEASLNFVSGPVSIGGGFVRANTTTEGNAAAERDIELMSIGASLNLDGIILRVGHIQRSEDLAVGGTAVVDADTTSVGVTIPLSGAVAAYATAFTGSDGANGAALQQRDMTGYQLGAQYNLSKRTNVYAVYGQNEFTGQGVAQSSKITGTSVGLRHSF
jgi:predicted porin